jgi:hypothetical protein
MIAVLMQHRSDNKRNASLMEADWKRAYEDFEELMTAEPRKVK